MRTYRSLSASLGGVVAACLLAFGAAAPAFAVDPPVLVRFDGGIGSQPLRAGATPDDSASNRVFGVQPGGVPWVIEDLKALIRVDGSVQIKGEGLLLGGTNNIGTRGGTENVRARLFCGGIAHTSAPFPLEADGDFTIKGTLTPALAPPPTVCENPVLLILNDAGATPAADRWFAAGILKPKAPKAP
ncbi:MAG TPA: hypothetical protein VF522_11230 [Ramlibacter sp.]|uniref:hypothetical protein n=1 Tax=Ramlibacter sp. TaxID=1917967 RepID=UPI002ED3291F